MEVSKELKDDIHEAILVVADTIKAKLPDDELIGGIVTVLEKYEPPKDVVDMAGKKRMPVKYVGKRPTYSDGLFGTGTWNKDEVKLISVSTARQMFNHPDVYIEGEEEESIDVIDIDEEKKEEDEEDQRLEDTRILVSQMTRKDTVKEFVATNYNGLKIPDDVVRLVDMKEFAVRQIDRYGIV
jgi:hypothetical protein